jgi:hypothetical protein
VQIADAATTSVSVTRITMMVSPELSTSIAPPIVVSGELLATDRSMQMLPLHVDVAAVGKSEPCWPHAGRIVNAAAAPIPFSTVRREQHRVMLPAV